MREILKVWAKTLDGREYGNELTEEEINKLKEQKIVVAFGASDDLCEFRGAINDEVGCYGGGTIYISSNGIFRLQMYDCKRENYCSFAREVMKQYKTIKAKWCDGWYDWSYETDIPHEEFSIMEDGESYCEGIIFSLNDLEEVNLDD